MAEKKYRTLSKDEEKALVIKRRQEITADQEKNSPPIPFEPRCQCCTSPYRNFIDALLIRGASYSSIAEKVPGEDGKKIDRRSVSSHAKKHLGYHESALRQLLEEEADFAKQNYEEGIRGAFTYRGLLEGTLRKFQEDLLGGLITVEARDALAVIQQLEKVNSESEAVKIEDQQLQIDALTQAMMEECDTDTQRRIAQRAESIYFKEKRKQLPPPSV